MLGRLLVPVLPLGLVFAELGLRELVAVKRTAIAAGLAIVGSLACVPTRIIEPEQFQWLLADERTFYGVASVRPLALDGAIFHRVSVLYRYFGWSPRPPVYAAYAIGILGWMTDWPVVDIYGLIDPELSRQPLTERGRPGHERHASRDQIIRRGADISAEPMFGERHTAWSRLVLDGEEFHLTHYRADLLDPLRASANVSFQHFPELIDEYTRTATTRPFRERVDDLAFFDRFYFAEHPDPVRRNRLLPHPL
jgi:hypothetical protein